MLRYLTIPKFAAESGYTEDAIRTKIRDGIWSQDQVWLKAPDGRILINVPGYEQWVETAGVLKLHRKAASKSVSCIKAPGAVSALRSSPQPLI
ncbi:excisionase [Massilia sp. CCM 8695]|uniref:Excisionase n=1 Tax=Massilia frigida TaxID=2609281 RepID=A0ABX0NGD5_9BURK|nr:excisionase [Massilia frigida]